MSRPLPDPVKMVLAGDIEREGPRERPTWNRAGQEVRVLGICGDPGTKGDDQEGRLRTRHTWANEAGPVRLRIHPTTRALLVRRSRVLAAAANLAASSLKGL